jgi:hypothetical protein
MGLNYLCKLGTNYLPTYILVLVFVRPHTLSIFGNTTFVTHIDLGNSVIPPHGRIFTCSLDHAYSAGMSQRPFCGGLSPNESDLSLPMRASSLAPRHVTTRHSSDQSERGIEPAGGHEPIRPGSISIRIHALAAERWRGCPIAVDPFSLLPESRSAPFDSAFDRLPSCSLACCVGTR